MVGPIADDDSFFTTDAYLVIGGVALALGLAASLVAPRGTRMRGFAKGLAIGLVLALVCYFCPPEIDGRGDFQFRSLLALALMATILPIVRTPGQSLRAQIFGGVVGIVAPPILLIALFVVTCSGECFS